MAGIAQKLNLLYRLGLERDEFVGPSGWQAQSIYRYFHTLGLMAKNDIFGTFEANLVVDFTACLEMALKAYGDWDGGVTTFGAAFNKIFEDLHSTTEFLDAI